MTAPRLFLSVRWICSSSISKARQSTFLYSIAHEWQVGDGRAGGHFPPHAPAVFKQTAEGRRRRVCLLQRCLVDLPHSASGVRPSRDKHDKLSTFPRHPAWFFASHQGWVGPEMILSGRFIHVRVVSARFRTVLRIPSLAHGGINERKLGKQLRQSEAKPSLPPQSGPTWSHLINPQGGRSSARLVLPRMLFSPHAGRHPWMMESWNVQTNTPAGYLDLLQWQKWDSTSTKDLKSMSRRPSPGSPSLGVAISLSVFFPFPPCTSSMQANSSQHE
jgi:hypothetical protein